MEKSPVKIPSGGHICPWWCAYTFDNPLRRLVHNPAQLLSPYVRPGMTVLDVGSGMGYFSIGMARLVGPSGRVCAVDIQEKMLRIMTGRARRAGVAERISPTLAACDGLGLETPIDFALAFWMVHEVPEPGALFREISQFMKPGALLLYAEPSFHVREALFLEILNSALDAGLAHVGAPKIRFSRTALLKKTAAAAESF